jgi:putative copper resistance protein D
MDALLAMLRTMHFAASLSLFGIAAFRVFILGPALRGIDIGAMPLQAAGVGRPLACAARISLGLWLVSLLLWLPAEAVSMSGQTVADCVRHGTFVTVLTRTQFGHNCELRLVFGALAMACLVGDARRPLGNRAGASVLLLIFSAVMLVSLAWIGHAGAMSGRPARIHLAADCAHLLAAGAWLGGLVPLALFYRRHAGAAWLSAARSATRRFSTLGLICVGAVIVSGIVNACFTVGTVALLTESGYGRLVLAKIALLAVMVGIAAMNRMILMPRLCAPPPGPLPGDVGPTIRRLQRNTLIEAAVGIVVLVVVGLLGITPPGQSFPY